MSLCSVPSTGTSLQKGVLIQTRSMSYMPPSFPHLTRLLASNLERMTKAAPRLTVVIRHD
jgi:hypothetical protein